MRMAIVATCLAACVFPAAGQGLQCAPAPVVDASLRQERGEEPAELGMSAGGPVVLYRAAETWTLVLMRPDGGLAGLLAAGRDWQAMPARRETPKAEEVPS